MRWVPQRASSVLASLALAFPIMILTLAGCPGGTPTPGGTGSQFNVPPRVVLSVVPDPPRGVAPLRVQFDSSQSTDDGIIVDRLWNFGDGTTSRETAPLKTYLVNGVYTVRLTLTDDQGASSSTTTVVRVSEAPIATFTIAFVPSDGSDPVLGQTTAANSPATFELDGSASFDPDAAPGDTLAFSWQFGDGVTATGAKLRHTYARAGTYRIQLAVTDATGIRVTTEGFVDVGITQPTIVFRSPPGNLSEITVSRRSPLWTYVNFAVASGVPYRISAGLDPDTTRDNGNDIPLDTNALDGVLVDDLPLTYPTALDLNTDPNIPQGVYNLWAELRTDRTSPQRVYATTKVRVVAPPTTNFTNAPKLTLVRAADGLDRAHVAMPNASVSQFRFVVNVGRVQKGDRLFFSFLTLPGYTESYLASDYRIQLFDGAGRYFLSLINTSQDLLGLIPPQLFTRDSSYLIGSTSDDFYVVVEPLRERVPPSSFNVAIRRSAVPPTFQPPTQRVYLNFQGTDSVAVSPAAVTFPVPPFDVDDPLAPRDNAAIMDRITQRVRLLLDPYNVVVTSSFDPNDPLTTVPAPTPPFSQVLFNTTSTFVPSIISSGRLLAFGRPDFIDPRNSTQTGVAVVAANVLLAFANDPSSLRSDEALADAMANSALHQLGFMFGLQETIAPTNDIMYYAYALDDANTFTTNPIFSPSGDLGGSAFGDPTLGFQDAPAYLLEVLGPKP